MADENVPAAHEAQSFSVAATLSENFPPSHCVHPADPLSDLYLPAVHASQAPPSTREYPALHWQSSTALLEFDEWEFGGHGRQREAFADEYLPAVHATQLSTFDPILSENVPGGHRSQSAEPTCSLYLPAAHARQIPFLLCA